MAPNVFDLVLDEKGARIDADGVMNLVGTITAFGNMTDFITAVIILPHIPTARSFVL